MVGMSETKRSTVATVWLLLLVAAAAGAVAAESGQELGCFCDCMKNQCMTLGAGTDKFDCAAACTEGCKQIGQPGQPRDDDFCGF